MPDVIRRFMPEPFDGELRNPHRGFCSFQIFEGDPLHGSDHHPSEAGPVAFPALSPNQLVPQPHPVTTVAYCRWFWSLLEPREGEYDFTVIDQALRQCEQRDLTLAVRLMAFGSRGQPQLPEWYTTRYPTLRWNNAKGGITVPVYEGPEFLSRFGGLIREFGRRYDGHSRLESIDVAYVGPWGEGDGACPVSRHREFADLWRESFVQTPRLAMIIDEQMVQGARTGCGWRCDCFGDLPLIGTEGVPFGHGWSHHYDCYPRAVVTSGCSRSWETAPVYLECCHYPFHWYHAGQDRAVKRYQGPYDLEFTLAQGLKLHASYFTAKSTPIPEAWLDRFRAWGRQLGYRLTCRLATAPEEVKTGTRFRFQSWIENTGVAPLYRPYRLALRMRHGEAIHLHPFVTADIRKWLPGDAWVEEEVAVPPDFPAGMAELALGIVDPSSLTPRVSFANRNHYADRWLRLGDINLTR